MHTHAHAHHCTDNLAMLSKTVCLHVLVEAICPRCLQHAKRGRSESHSRGWGHKGTSLSLGPSHRLLSAGNNEPFMKGSRSGVEELELAAQGRAANSPCEFTNLQGRVEALFSSAESCKQHSWGQRGGPGESSFSHSLSVAPHGANAFCSH